MNANTCFQTFTKHIFFINKYHSNKKTYTNAYDLKLATELSKQDAETIRIAEEQDQLNLDRGVGLSLQEYEMFEAINHIYFFFHHPIGTADSTGL